MPRSVLFLIEGDFEFKKTYNVDLLFWLRRVRWRNQFNFVMKFYAENLVNCANKLIARHVSYELLQC